jgi:hypothetical protein
MLIFLAFAALADIPPPNATCGGSVEGDPCKTSSVDNPQSGTCRMMLHSQKWGPPIEKLLCDTTKPKPEPPPPPPEPPAPPPPPEPAPEPIPEVAPPSPAPPPPIPAPAAPPAPTPSGWCATAPGGEWAFTLAIAAFFAARRRSRREIDAIGAPRA